MMAPVEVERPPSPPHSNDGDFGLVAVRDHVADLERQSSPRSIPAAPMSALVSLSASQQAQPTPKRRVSIDEVKDQYGDPLEYQTAPTPAYYPQPPPHVQTFQRMVLPHTPPGTDIDTGVRTRSSRPLGSPLEPSSEMSRRSETPKGRRQTRKTKKGGSPQAPIIDQPLSMLTKDYTIPVKDMNAWVNRSAETRLEEIAKKNGYIPRPMNSFMLYRSAYAERVKRFCKENNHQVVSRVSGASWPLEPQVIRDMYEKYASIERENHQAAHPNYKFAPNKDGKASKRRKEWEDDSDDEDGEWHGTPRSSKRSKNSSRSHSSTPFEGVRQPQHPLAHLHPSSYQASNPHRPLPTMVGPNRNCHYYQTTVTPYGQYIQDVGLQRIDDPFPTPPMNQALLGLPNGNHAELMRDQSGVPTPVPSGLDPLDPLDPQLLQYDQSAQYFQYEQLDPRYYDYGPGYPPQQPQYGYPTPAPYHPGMATLTDDQGYWGPDGGAGSDFDDELRKLG